MARHSRFKVQAFFYEFPFLQRLLEETGYEESLFGDVEEVHVKRIDVNFLTKVPAYKGATGSLVGIEDSERILLVDWSGEFLTEPRQARHISHNEAYRDNEEQEGESVGEALTLLGDTDSVVYAVCVHTGYRIRNHCSIGGYSVTLYKPPKGFSLRGWVEEQQRHAEQMLEAEVAAIDAEATT